MGHKYAALYEQARDDLASANRLLDTLDNFRLFVNEKGLASEYLGWLIKRRVGGQDCSQYFVSVTEIPSPLSATKMTPSTVEIIERCIDEQQAGKK
jgi:hypothetical protein